MAKTYLSERFEQEFPGSTRWIENAGRPAFEQRCKRKIDDPADNFRGRVIDAVLLTIIPRKVRLAFGDRKKSRPLAHTPSILEGAITLRVRMVGKAPARNNGDSLGSTRLAADADDSDAASKSDFAAASSLAAGSGYQHIVFEEPMTPVAVGTAIGAAALTVGRGAIGAVGNGLSFAAELARAAGGMSSSPSGAEARQAEAAHAAIKLRSDELRERIQRQLTAAGIALSEPVELVSNGQGGIAVAGTHPQQAAIEAALGSDVLLERDFNLLASDYREFVEASGTGDMPPTLTVTVPKSS